VTTVMSHCSAIAAEGLIGRITAVCGRKSYVYIARGPKAAAIGAEA
jgi:hypothetical protein